MEMLPNNSARIWSSRGSSIIALIWTDFHLFKVPVRLFESEYEARSAEILKRGLPQTSRSGVI